VSTTNGHAAQTTELAGPPLPHSVCESEAIPRVVGKFRVLDLLAQGMALVYKAEQDNPHRMVALKIPRGGRLLDPEARERFLLEVGLMASIDHAGIVPVLEVGEIDGTPFYTMPFIQGHSLADFVAMEKPGLARRMDVFRRICSVVQALHTRGLVHRDLKPENLMIDQYGDVRLLDFGLAKALAESAPPTATQTTVAGTLQYMAPEQTLPQQLDCLLPAADVYSLGVILYWLLTDSLPYAVSGPREIALATVRAAIIRPPSQLKPDLGGRFDRVVMACLAKDSATRPPNAGALAAILADQRSAVSAPSSSNKALWLIAIGVGVLVIAAVLAFRREKNPPGLRRRQFGRKQREWRCR